MANVSHFRFLDLPKELRLMVYERLPVKVTHHTFELDTVEGLENDLESLQLVHRTITGIAILHTSSQIHDEASTILRPKLNTWRSELIMLIANYNMLWHYRMLGLIDCLSLSPTNCDQIHDLRNLLANDVVPGHVVKQHAHTQYPMSGKPARQIPVAIRYVHKANFYVSSST